jgi:AmiR/NasT family two-component response regulator
MARLRVLVAEDDALTSLNLREQLESLGHQAVGEARSGREAVEMAASARPDAVVMDIKMPEMDGIDAAREIRARHPCPIVLLTAYDEPELIERAADAGVFAYLMKPADARDLEPTLQLARSRFQEFQTLCSEIDDLQEALRVRKLIERAKGILMQRHGLAEAEAFRRMQKRARDTNRKLGEVAEAIIAAEQLL